ncbi:glycosyltransferase 87 family protein [Azospirillum sp. sgz301742]
MDGAGVQREAADGGAHSPAGLLRADWGLMLWIFVNASVAALALFRPLLPSTRTFVAASLDWWAGEPLYAGASGFLHLPAAAVLFTPFALLPMVAADQLWRLLSVAVLTLAVYRAARLLRPDDGGRIAQHVLVLAIPTIGLDLLHNRWELITLGVLLHATADIAMRHEARGGLLLALAAALNPAALVPALLFGAVCRRVLPWLMIGLAAVLLGPFLHPHPAYVAQQYAALIEALPRAAGGFDLASALRDLGFEPAYASMTGVRIVTAGAVLWAGMQASRRLDRPSASVAVLMLGVPWVLLFDPRTTEGTYATLAVLAGLAAFAEHARRPLAALPVLLGAMALALGLHLYGDWIQRPVQGWLRQALALAFAGYVAMLIATGRSLTDPPPEPVHINTWLPNRVALVLCLLVPPAFGVYRLITADSLRGRLSSFDTTDFLILVVSLNVLAFALVTAAGPVLAWMRGRRN